MSERKGLLCYSCGEPIKFIKTAAGKMMPVDPKPFYVHPNKSGKDRVVNEYGEIIACDLPAKPGEPWIVAYMPHFATCRHYTPVKTADKADTDKNAASLNAPADKEQLSFL